MTPWFTLDRIDNKTFILSEYRHWEETHCYLLCGTKKALLIDTGLGICDISAEVNGSHKERFNVLIFHEED